MAERFNYKACIKKLNEIVPPTKMQLPPVDMKTGKMAQINGYVREHIPPILYRYMPISFNAIPSILTGDVYLLPAAKMNDVFEGAAFGINSSEEINNREIDRIQERVYLKAFTYAPNNNLMWSHYGDAHKGICVGYDFNKLRENRDNDDVIEHLYPVQYSNTRFSNLSAEQIATHPFLCLRKSSCWKYEKEFRLIYDKYSLNEKKTVNLNCIKEIQFGLRTDPLQIEIITSLVKDKGIKLYRTKQKENSYELTREEIEIFHSSTENSYPSNDRRANRRDNKQF